MLRTDCRYFKGDRPCAPHKERGVKCDDCNDYKPINFKILIIKLDAVGDVLRTTSILRPLKKKFRDSYITWCTRQNSKVIFKYNTIVDEVIAVDDDAYFRLRAEEFDLVINLDTSKLSSGIASSISGKKKMGFVLNKKGYVEATSETAQIWLEMSAFDDVKKANIKSYQQIMYEILEIDFPVALPLLPITNEEKNKIKSKQFYKEINQKVISIGLNIGVGSKWPSKGWPLIKWQELINNLEPQKYNLLLLAGPEEELSANQLLSNNNLLINTGCNNSLLEFAAIVELCDMIITADTLALHIATALEKKIIALFGPTSSSEIEIYSKGIKLFLPEGCKCYYKKYCKENISCLEKITPEMVLGAVNKLFMLT